ncbi:SGNH hydrolase superfamily [Sesbania bispinosa]|nr:SGNH hydrolase superfamily [Sesbania bispinosa]
MQPSLVIVYFGGNDSIDPHPSGLGPHVPLQEYLENMRKIANHLKGWDSSISRGKQGSGEGNIKGPERGRVEDKSALDVTANRICRRFTILTLQVQMELPLLMSPSVSLVGVWNGIYRN